MLAETKRDLVLRDRIIFMQLRIKILIDAALTNTLEIPFQLF
jgi:hypothetical protein